MRAYRLGKATIVTALAGGLLVGAAFAEAPPPGTSRAGGGNTAGELGVRTEAAVTPEEQLAQADAVVRRAGQLAERLSKMLDEARREKDIMRANCINRKLTEVNANARNVEQRSKALRDAAAAGDDGRRSHEYTVLTVLAQKLNSLDQEATQCLGQGVYEPGASQVITTVPNNVLVGTDPSTVPATPPPPPAVNVPPDASPMG